MRYGQLLEKYGHYLNTGTVTVTIPYDLYNSTIQVTVNSNDSSGGGADSGYAQIVTGSNTQFT